MDLFVLGEIIKTRGLRGCVKILSYVQTPEVINRLEFVYLENDLGQKKYHAIRNKEKSNRFLFLELEEVDNLNTAKSLIGCKVLIPASLLDVLPQGEYYWRDIIGLDVYTEDGKHLGRIESIFPTGSNDVYVCKGEKEILFPAIADVIQQIDLTNKIITVKLLPGL